MVFQTDLELEVPPDLDDNNCMMNEMKAKVERCYNRRNTSLVGYVETTWNEINEIFGPIAEECRMSNGDKSFNEWEFLINGEPVCIYDYKEGAWYNGETPITFHVGGKSIQALFELMVVGFKPEQVLTQSDYRDRVFAKFSA